ncbi:3-hydroxyacyl-ACP dehydratase FabZ family protein [Pelagicoccus sp. SDUM812003]|uniref:3-hydroxyacyl-ACP dehydratase FabZ family protein n=1 Tax=Pelagicoccus sp. SDUM812003 TaxID=3041267 RepID=UPI00280D6819|nr:3-hydroxyacyl-ACP dehydratase FabZ family protein [Pelagicoccus sp. SDUM812003]MDQ8203179.1 beta-hydroxyacyl-ACP dehydratase [Pelagicoccus sp. SDUM812003]
MASEEILQAIPHRPPFLFVDEIVEQTDDYLTTRRFVSETESFFEGHYPGNPIMPGVIISEAVFQTGAIYLTRLLADEILEDPELVPVLTKISDARFKSIVKPNETLYITARYKEKLGRFIFMDGSVKTEDGRRVMTVSFSVALAKAPKDEA